MIANLSARQSEVYLRLAMGERNEDIARELRISTKTVDTHRSHVLKALHLRNNTELARHALAHGHVPPFGTSLEQKPLPDINYEVLDPGIRSAVRFLRHQGFDTVDSGDGRTKPVEHRTIEGPHVFCRVAHYALAQREADRAYSLLCKYVDTSTDDPQEMLLIEASYSAIDKTSILSITGKPLLRITGYPLMPLEYNPPEGGHQFQR